MTPEAALWQRIKPALERVGVPVRLENAAAESVPDVALICELTTFWLELKIAKGNRVRMPKFQHIFARKIAAESPQLVWIVVDYGGRMVLIQYCTIKEVEPTKNEKYVEYDIRNSRLHYVTDLAKWLTERIRI